jgi:rfaE bifunctional protein kinase chain/domain
MTADTSTQVDEVIAKIRSRVWGDGRVVFVSGDFNIIHPGHLRIFNFAAECGDFLVVGVNADGHGRTIVSADMRLDNVAAISVVDHALVLPVPAEEFIRRLQPEFVVKGREHANRFNIEQEIVAVYGGKLLFCSGDVGFSSVDLLRRELHNTNLATVALPEDFPQRHNFKPSHLVALVRNFADLRVVVIGDLIIDDYVDCEPLGMSREDPTLVVSPILSERFVGGAGIVAAHAAGMGATVSYFSVGGGDEPYDYAVKTLEGYGVRCHILKDDTRPTTVKQRFRARQKTLLRVSHLRQHEIASDIVAEMLVKLRPVLAEANLVVFSDFNYGCVAQSLVDQVVAYCRERGIAMVADSQASSQVSDVSRFKGMKLLTPTEHEARLAVGDFQSGLVVLADTLRDKAEAEHVLLTLAEEGVLIHSPDEPSGLITDRLPAFNSTPRDVAGAGDSLLTCASMALSLGANIWQASYLGSVAAACQVSRLGNLPLTAKELIAELSS